MFFKTSVPWVFMVFQGRLELSILAVRGPCPTRPEAPASPTGGLPPQGRDVAGHPWRMCRWPVCRAVVQLPLSTLVSSRFVPAVAGSGRRSL